MSKKKPITFERKISKLQNEKSELTLSFWQKQKKDYKERIEELLKSPVNGWEDAVSKMKKFKKYYAKLEEIDDRIANLPENVEDAIKEIDDKISFYKGKRKETRSIPLYRETEQWIADVFWTDIIQYAKKTNNTELIDKLKKRSLTPDEYAEFYDYDYDKHEEMQKLYDELFNTSEEGKTSEENSQLEKDNQTPTIRRNIEKPRDTLSKLDIRYQIVDWIILPTNWNTTTIRRSKAVPQGHKELAQEYEDKINILFSRVLTSENWFESEDYNVVAWMESKHMVRKTTYVIVEIPSKNKMIILNNGYWEVSFLCDEMLEKSLLTSVSKEELVKKHWESIKKLEFRDEDTWVDEVLGRLGETWKDNSVSKISWVGEENSEEKMDVDIENWTEEDVQENVEENEQENTEEKEKELTEEKLEQEIEEEDNNNIIAELESKIPIRPEEDLTKDDAEALKNILKPYFDKDDDFKDVFAYVLQKNGWGLVVLKNKEFKGLLSKYEEWAKKNEKLVERELKKIHSGRGRWNLQAKDLAKLNLFMSMFFENEVKKMVMNYKELKKMFNENSELIEKLKELEANLWLNRVDGDNVEHRMNQGDLELEQGIMDSFLHVFNKCIKMFETGTMNDSFCEICKKVVDFLSEYKIWFMRNNEWEKKVPNVETLLGFVVDFYQNGMIDGEERDNIRKLLERKNKFEVEKVEFNENEKIIEKMEKENQDTENEFRDLKMSMDTESNFKRVWYNLRRSIIEIYKKKQRGSNILLEYKSYFVDENGDIKKNFTVQDAEKFIDYLFNNMLIDENIAKNLMKLLYVNKILDLNNEEMWAEEKEYIVNYIIDRGGQSFRIKFDGWFKPEVRMISDWGKYPNLESTLRKLWFICVPKREWSQTQKESSTVQVNNAPKNGRKTVDDKDSQKGKQNVNSGIVVFEKESKFIESLEKSENKVDEFRNFIQKLEWEETGREIRKTKLEEVDELDRKFPGALDMYIDECIEKWRLLFAGCYYAFDRDWKFDFSVIQAGILDKAVDAWGDKQAETLKEIFEHLGFFMSESFDFSEKMNDRTFKKWIISNIRTIIKKSHEERMWCFSREYWENKDKWKNEDWHKFNLQHLPIDVKHVDYKFAIWEGNEPFRVWLLGAENFYLLYRIFSNHKTYGIWLDSKTNAEKKSFFDATGVELE